MVRVLSVFHFWLKLRPRSLILYLVSRWPADFPESVLLEPEVANSCKRDGVMRGVMAMEIRWGERQVAILEHNYRNYRQNG